MDSADRKSLSKYLSLVLRHDPGAAGIALDPAGWVRLDQLIAGARAKGQRIDSDAVLDVVATSDKKRFTLSDDGQRIRAAQGHSVPVDLGLAPVEPPERLYHGTAERNRAAILQDGLIPGTRQHVHLSPDPETARKVGMRHGAPLIFAVAAGRAHRDGQPFWRAENGVWLTGPLSPAYLTPMQDAR